MSLKNTDIVILCGGLGTRLKGTLGELPKAMARVKGQPFLDILVQYVSSFGFQRFILCTGYKSEVIERYYKRNKNGQEIIISREKTPLGTGGAVKEASKVIRSDRFLVMNGDSFCFLDFTDFVDFHKRKEAFISIGLNRSYDARDYGSITMNRLGRVKAFDEKKVSRKALVNVGIYLFERSVLSLMPYGEKFSLEYDFFPKNINNRMYGFLTEGSFIDIGTPQRYKKATKFFNSMVL